MDAIKEQKLSENISKCRNLAKALRKPTNASKIKNENYRNSKLSCPTRWNSDFDMVERLLELKTFCLRHRTDDKDLDVAEDIWKFMVEFVDIFRPIKMTTLQLQNKQMLLGDFYKLWLKLKIELGNKSSPYKHSLLKIIEVREKNLLENSTFLAALLLDPRFNFLLTREKKAEARIHLKSVWDNWTNFECQQIQIQSTPSTSANLENQPQNQQTVSDGDDVLLAYLNNKEEEQRNASINNRQKCYLEIENYTPERQRDHSANILQYWE